MGVKFFGQYLLEKKLIGREQLLDALEYQLSRNLKFGDYAVKKGYLTEEQVRSIQHEQKSLDLQFGELAVRLEFLTEGQVREILTLQKNDYIYLGEAIAEKGFLSKGAIDAELEAFRVEQEQYQVGRVTMPPETREPTVVEVIVDLSVKLLGRVAHMVVKAGTPEVVEGLLELPGEGVGISFNGGFNGLALFAFSEENARKMAAKVIGDDGASKEPPEVILDALQEFVNIVGGNVVAKLGQMGKTVDISPPEVFGVSYEAAGRQLIVFPLHTTEGAITLAVVS